MTSSPPESLSPSSSPEESNTHNNNNNNNIKRAVLWTANRGSRGLSAYQTKNSDGKEITVIMTGSALVTKQNRMHKLQINNLSEEDNNTTKPFKQLQCQRVYDIPSEDWSHQLIKQDEHGQQNQQTLFLVMTRHQCESAVSIWSFSDDRVITVSRLALHDGSGLKAIYNQFDKTASDTSVMAISDTAVNLLHLTRSSLNHAQVIWSNCNKPPQNHPISDGAWLNINTMYITTGKYIRLFDVRTPSHPVQHSAISHYPPILSAAAAMQSTTASVIYAGATNGSIYAFDIRRMDNCIKFDQQHGHDGHRVSAVSCSEPETILTGGTDGVVTSWNVNPDGVSHISTYPQHDDTVTNIISLPDSQFASISYDGRVALANL